MQNPRYRVRFPFLSSVIHSGWWSGLLFAAVIAGGRVDGEPELRTERMIGPGVKWTTLIRSRGPWVIRIMEADGESRYIRPGATFASPRGLRAAPLSAQAQQATSEARFPIAGVNGDFFNESPGPYEADPIGALVIDGEVIHTPYPRSAFLFGPDGRYTIERLRLSAWAERADGVRQPLQGVNQPCGANDLVLYTPRFGLTTPAASAGATAALTGLDLPVRLGQTYHARVQAVGEQGNASIPADGVVLLGRGTACRYLQALKPGDDCQFRLEFDPPVASDTDVVGGGPALVREGRVVVQEETEGFQPDVIAGRAPRTAIGFNGRRLFVVTVDGRQVDGSVGMSLLELGQLMQELGCTDAMNLDGGGSTTAWVRGTVVNHPSAGRERRLAEGVFLFSTAPKGPAARLTVAPDEIAILAGASCPLAVSAEDEFYNPVAPPSAPVALQLEPDLGTIAALDGGRWELRVRDDPALSLHLRSGPTCSERTFTVQGGKLAGTARLRIYARPPRLTISPLAPLLPAGGSQAFSIQALDEYGQPLVTTGVPVHWSCPTELGEVDADGLFHAAGAPARGELTAEVAGTRATVPVVVGLETRILDGFESADGGNTAQPVLSQAQTDAGRGGPEATARWSISTTPPGVQGSLTFTDSAPHEGRQALRLEYDFSTQGATRAVYANTHLPLGHPIRLRLWVRGNGGGAWLRARLRDSQGQARVLDFTRNLGHLTDWRELVAAIPPNCSGPLTLEALYLVEPNLQSHPRGTIDLDALAGDYAPDFGPRGATGSPINAAPAP